MAHTLVNDVSGALALSLLFRPSFDSIFYDVTGLIGYSTAPACKRRAASRKRRRHHYYCCCCLCVSSNANVTVATNESSQRCHHRTPRVWNNSKKENKEGGHQTIGRCVLGVYRKNRSAASERERDGPTLLVNRGAVRDGHKEKVASCM